VNVKIAEIYLNQRQFEDAVRFFKKALATGGEKFAIYYHMARAYQELGNLEKAYVAYNQVLDAFPIFFMARYNIGLVLFDQGDYPKAIESFEKTLKMNPQFNAALYQIGKSFLKLGEDEKAKDKFKEYLAKVPNGEMAPQAKAHLAKL
jgi:tetratricopeptide (TPR) repeat protein